MATWESILLQDSSSPLMEQLSFFHDHTLLILLMIMILVGQFMLNLFSNNLSHRFLLEGQIIEMIWTILPAVVLAFVALPSLRLIYILDEVKNSLISIKTTGHQWYWSYEYSDFINIEFDSYMTPSKSSPPFSFRLLETDNHLIIPYKTPIRLIVSAADVIHSWTIPSLGVKIDASPGRLNQTGFNCNRPGLFYGQCSEICGTNHSFMPIVLESVSFNLFSKWLKSN
uniref:Cytochrome c oxidase subunit 2 n=1 Tax=Pelecotoma fennica TaxID=433262 RepID=A0A343A481_9CUCU|nr:cytochrome c oxidase subunit II [Pelecotoma fennica]AOY39359.1 cytochrome c oxidase subunit 2 [Pelecotoma fennica]